MDEVKVLSNCMKMLAKLDPESRKRVMTYLNNLNFEQPTKSEPLEEPK